MKISFCHDLTDENGVPVIFDLDGTFEYEPEYEYGHLVSYTVTAIYLENDVDLLASSDPIAKAIGERLKCIIEDEEGYLLQVADAER